MHLKGDCDMKIYKSYFTSGKLMQIARIIHLPSERYAFETSNLGKGKFELNMNMPMFYTEAETSQWIENNPEWQLG